MAETLINNNQLQPLNTDKLTVAACSKVFGDLHDTLLQKGVAETDISADNPTGLVDAVKALPTNTIGAIKRDFPITLLPKNMVGKSQSFYHEVVGDYFIKQHSADVIHIFDMSKQSFDENCQQANGGDLRIKIDKALIQSAIGGDITLGTIYLKHIPGTLNAVYTDNAGHAGVITSDAEAGTISATCVNLSNAENSLYSGNLTGKAFKIFATNGELAFANCDYWSDVAASNYPNFLINLQTGSADIQNWTFFQHGSSSIGYDSTYYNGVYFCVNGYSTWSVKINWGDIESSALLRSVSYGSVSQYGFFNNKVYSLISTSNMQTLEIYDTLSGQVKNINLGKTYQQAFLTLNGRPTIYNNRRCLFIERLENGYIQICSIMGFIWLDENEKFINPISGYDYISVTLKNGNTPYSQFSPDACVPVKYKDKYYLIDASNNDALNNGLIGRYYGKVIGNFYIRNEQQVIYFYNGTMTKSLLDGNTLDADTVSISVDVNGGAQEAGAAGS